MSNIKDDFYDKAIERPSEKLIKQGFNPKYNKIIRNQIFSKLHNPQKKGTGEISEKLLEEVMK